MPPRPITSLISYLPIFLGAIGLKYNNPKDAMQAIIDSEVLLLFANLQGFRADYRQNAHFWI
jgi:hypothetical protein